MDQWNHFYWGFVFFAVQGAIKSTQDISRAASLAGHNKNDDTYYEFNSLTATWKWRFYDLNLWKAIRGDDKLFLVKIKPLITEKWTFKSDWNTLGYNDTYIYTYLDTVYLHSICIYIYSKWKNIIWHDLYIFIYIYIHNIYMKETRKSSNNPFAKKLKLEQLTIRSSALWCQHAVAGFVLLSPSFRAESWPSLEGVSLLKGWNVPFLYMIICYDLDPFPTIFERTVLSIYIYIYFLEEMLGPYHIR